MARRTPRRGDCHLDALTDRTRGPFFLHRTYVFSAPAASYNRKRSQKRIEKRETFNMEHPNTPLPDRIARAVADYHAELYRFAALRTGSRSDAEDIVQEAFLRLLTARGEITHLRAYLYRCVANACCDRKRRHAVFEPLGPQLPADDGEAPLREEAERIAALLDRLPEEQAEVIRLHTFASLRFTEIAQTLQLPASTVKSRFHYGIERLKKLM